MLINIYKRLTLFFWRLWTEASGPDMKKPVGVPYQRDPDNPCEMYRPLKSSGFFKGCEGDGHYLCKKCVHFENSHS